MSNLEDEIVQELSEKMCSDIDFEILCGMLCKMGWTKVVLGPMTHETSNAIDQWVLDHVKNHHQARGIVWVFEDNGDAVNFTLKWAN